MRQVASGLIIENSKLLVARKEVSGKSSWIFPGGKVEPGEHASDCLVRELGEELPYMRWEGLWVPWRQFYGISPNNKSPIEVIAFCLDGQTNGDYRPSNRPNEPIKETRLVGYLDLLNLGLSDVSREIVCKLQQERRI